MKRSHDRNFSRDLEAGSDAPYELKGGNYIQTTAGPKKEKEECDWPSIIVNILPEKLQPSLILASLSAEVLLALLNS